jgi:mRNA-degrading endonuclease RelE of RelBE toxin-antitoxin system
MMFSVASPSLTPETKKELESIRAQFKDGIGSHIAELKSVYGPYDFIISSQAQKQFASMDKQDYERIVMLFKRMKINPDSNLAKINNETSMVVRTGSYAVLMDLVRDKYKLYVLKVGRAAEILKQ